MKLSYSFNLLLFLFRLEWSYSEGLLRESYFRDSEHNLTDGKVLTSIMKTKINIIFLYDKLFFPCSLLFILIQAMKKCCVVGHIVIARN